MVQTLHKSLLQGTKDLVNEVNAIGASQSIINLVIRQVDMVDRFEEEWINLYLNMFN